MRKHPQMVRGCFVALGLGLGITCGGIAQTDDLKDSIDQIRKELAGTEIPKDPQKAQQRERFRMLLEQLPDAMAAEGSSINLENTMQQLAMLTDSDAIRDQCAKIVATLRAKRKASEKIALAKIDEALKAAGDTVQTASKPEDIDSALRSLSALQNNRGDSDYSPVVEQRRQQIDSGLQFLWLWQDYLSYKASGNLGNASEALTNLAQQDRYSLNWIPRSELLKRIQELRKPASQNSEPPDDSAANAQRAAAILARIKAPEDLAGAISDLQAIVSSNRRGNISDIENSLRSLKSLDNGYRNFQSGLAAQIELIVPSGISFDYSNPVPEVRQQIVLLVLPRYLGLPFNQKVNPGENAATFLERVESEAASRGDYQLAAKAADTESLLRDGSRATANSSQAGLFVIGQNQEAAGQISLAVASYEKALAQPLRIVPPEIIGKRLEEISKKYPDDFQKGVDLYLAPPFMDPMSRDAVMRESAMRAQMMGTRQFPPSSAMPPQQPPPPVLSIPSVASRPVTAPASAPSPSSKTP